MCIRDRRKKDEKKMRANAKDNVSARIRCGQDRNRGEKTDSGKIANDSEGVASSKRREIFTRESGVTKPREYQEEENIY